jgi:2-polyprenyl-3-methyl-5-hydroxy-6-metoxy-1,4-benzoquinol methylase
LSHVTDHAAFVAKLASLLKPGGLMMMATQNRPALEKNDMPPPAPGQLRRWFDRDELLALLKPAFEVEELFSITPKYNRGPLKLINADKVRDGLHAVGLDFVLTATDRVQEKAWMGWTLMALAKKR